MIRVAVSILSYNSAHSTIACVQSLLAACHMDNDPYFLNIFVTDNDSATEDQHYLQQSLAESPNIHLKMNSSNCGFAAGHNGNLRTIFRQSHPDYVWLLNNDCLVYKETLSSLIKCAKKHPYVGIWGATLLEKDGQAIQCAGGCYYNSWVSSYRQYGWGKTLAEIGQLESVDFDYIAGASLFFPVATLQSGLRSFPVSSRNGNTDQQQWLNESFFLYFEELDLAKRLKPGVEMAWCKSALVKHSGGISTATSNDRRTVMTEYHSTLSALKFTRLHYPRRFWFMAPTRYLFKCLQLLVEGKIQLVRPITQAYRDFWRE